MTTKTSRHPKRDDKCIFCGSDGCGGFLSFQINELNMNPSPCCWNCQMDVSIKGFQDVLDEKHLEVKKDKDGKDIIKKKDISEEDIEQIDSIRKQIKAAQEEAYDIKISNMLQERKKKFVQEKNKFQSSRRDFNSNKKPYFNKPLSNGNGHKSQRSYDSPSNERKRDHSVEYFRDRKRSRSRSKERERRRSPSRDRSRRRRSPSYERKRYPIFVIIFKRI